MHITTGITGTASRIVTEKDTAKVIKSGSLPVLATPVLSALMEEASCAALQDGLEGQETTVGGFIGLTHKAPTLPGETITATATVTEVKGKKIFFHITASDSHGEIGEADHTRFLVLADKFMEKAKERSSRR